MTVLDFISKKTKFHSNMKYNAERMSFVLQPYKDSTAGIYFILYKKDILKIGKADGKFGLKGRISDYSANLSTRYNLITKKGDHTVKRYYEKMTGELKGKILKMYILQLPAEKRNIMGFEIELNMARSLEKILSKKAKEENHSMLLSGQD